MKVAVVVSKFPVVSETFILNQITGLLDMGHEVGIFAFGGDSETQVQDDVGKYDLMKKVVYLPKVPANKMMRRLKALAALSGFFFDRPIWAAKIVKHFLGHSRAVSYQAFFLVLAVLKRDFKIIHCHYGYNGNFAYPVKWICPEIKVLTTFHGYDVNGHPKAEGLDVYKDLFGNGDLFTANTEFTRQKVISLGGRPEQIEILPVGLRIEDFKFRARTMQKGKPVKILTMARLVEKKGYIYAIEAIARIAGRYNIVYDIAGDGPLAEQLQRKVKELGLEGIVRFHGNLVGEQVRKIYADAHIFVLPSVTASNGDMEGQGLVLQEAQACGLPVVTTRHNGIPDGVLEGKSAFLVAEKDVDSLAERIEYLVGNPQVWPEMGRCGREFVEKNYDIRILNRRLVEIYDRLAGRV